MAAWSTGGTKVIAARGQHFNWCSLLDPSMKDSFRKPFPSLSALVRYYRVFCYYDLRTGAVEAFPLWSDHRIVIDDD
ncbi:unnamed protein product [Heligmosomoides polygyrus]|uniref:Uncharacterized protein n=1 Tax=Heligmosomoides polygyrus TaxID=6339 RepID=A0A183FLH7_HELPZ|nr:unnamed protein product [Heligmosomoides polygyrus]